MNDPTMPVPPPAALHQRILAACSGLFEQAHFKHAAREAWVQVELALKDKCLAPSRRDYGQPLIDYAFGDTGAVSLKTSFGPQYRDQAKKLFCAAFSYYRNYTSHDGSNITAASSYRCLVLASELLDMIEASSRSLNLEGGVEGLVTKGLFESKADFISFLTFIDGQNYPDETWDGLMEDLAHHGYDWEQILLTEDLGLVQEEFEPLDGDCHDYGLTSFRLTPLGRTFQKAP
ncbi:MAG: TIGR02391 family protein [Planctomycetota bacterium]